MPKITPADIRLMKGAKPRFLALTAYNHAMAKILDEAGAEILHVGDTLGIFELGFPDTTQVTMDQMLHHTAAVARAKPRALITADLPIHAYDTVADAVENSRRLMQAGAEAVKMEGGVLIEAQIAAVLAVGIPVQGHLGLLPQTDQSRRKKGKNFEEHRMLIAEAVLLENLGCFSVVLENVLPEVACEVTRVVDIPTIGIASGAVCDGEIRVTPDVMGLCPWQAAAFVKPEIQAAALMQQAIRSYREKL